MIEVYKVGLKYYDTLKSDKNSGLFECEIIKRELRGIICQQKILVIINGLNSPEENEQVLNMMKDYDKKIFIMSDSIAMETCKQIMEKCDVVLHQRFENYEEIKTRQAYSYVPELFYKYICEYPIMEYQDKFECVNFGGNNLRRQDKFDAYNISDKIYSTRIKSYTEGYDARVNHDEYIAELAGSKYSLMICREEYRNINWVTARFYESIAVDCLPLVDTDYCKGLEYIFGKENIIRVSNFEDVKNVMQSMTKERFFEIINKLRFNCFKRRNRFVLQILKEMEEN